MRLASSWSLNPEIEHVPYMPVSSPPLAPLVILQPQDLAPHVRLKRFSKSYNHATRAHFEADSIAL
jgi:hypothetical protein